MEKSSVAQRSEPLKFLKDAQTDPKLSARVLLAVERGAKLTAEEVVEIAREFGYSFSRDDFQAAVEEDIEERFRAGESGLEPYTRKKKPKDPPESSCASGCLSWTVSWHPSDYP
jgi:hypothetical protein